MTRRSPAAVLLVIGALMLLGHQYASAIGGAMPFGTAHRSTYDGLITVVGLCALIGSWALGRFAARRWIWRGLGLTVGVAVTAVAAYVPYHLRHGPLFIPDGFRGHPERVTPFHEQLAVPVFMTLGFAVAILALALLTRARRALPSAALDQAK
jgi:hypothetical protein